MLHQYFTCPLGIYTQTFVYLCFNLYYLRYTTLQYNETTLSNLITENFLKLDFILLVLQNSKLKFRMKCSNRFLVPVYLSSEQTSSLLVQILLMIMSRWSKLTVLTGQSYHNALKGQLVKVPSISFHCKIFHGQDYW